MTSSPGDQPDPPHGTGGQWPPQQPAPGTWGGPQQPPAGPWAGQPAPWGQQPGQWGPPQQGAPQPGQWSAPQPGAPGPWGPPPGGPHLGGPHPGGPGRGGSGRGRLLAVLGAVLAVVVAAVVVTVVLAGHRDDPGAPAASPAAPPSAGGSARASASGAGATTSCTYLPDTSGNPSQIDVGTPPDPGATPASGTVTLRMSTNRGTLTLTLDRSKAPCAAASFRFLAAQKFFDGSPCHRLVDQPGFGVLQCGDPTGTGTGGPGYSYGQETTATTTYPRGTIAMANTGQADSTGSQFFLCFTDTALPPAYSVVGTVDQAGLAVLDQVAAAGDDGSFASTAGGGAPKLPVTITSMTVER